MILVTGAAGRLGRKVVNRLLEDGMEVLGTDQVTFNESPTAYVQANLCESNAVGDLLNGISGIIHLGAIPGPTRHTPHEIFENNVMSTYNLMSAASDCAIKRIVFSSSAFGMGWAHDPGAFIPKYLPLDEDHPMMPFESYGLSKQIGECIGAMISRHDTTSVASLRFTNVATSETQSQFPWKAPTMSDPLTLVMWAYADARDVIEMHLLSLKADFNGHEAFLIAQPKTRFKESTSDLIEANFSSSIPLKHEMVGNASVISTLKAQTMLGFKPIPDWHRT